MVYRGFKTETNNGCHRTCHQPEGRQLQGQLKTLSFRASIDILLNPSKSSDTQPDYRVYSQTVETGAGWIKKGQTAKTMSR